MDSNGSFQVGLCPGDEPTSNLAVGMFHHWLQMASRDFNDLLGGDWPFSIKNSHLWHVVYPILEVFIYTGINRYKCGRVENCTNSQKFPRWEGGFEADPTALVQTCGCFTARHRFGVRRSGEPHGRQCRSGWDAPFGFSDDRYRMYGDAMIHCRHVPISWNSGWFTWSWWLTYDPYSSSLKSNWF